MNDCIFCKIAQGQIRSKKILETDDVVAFHDLSPQASFHALIIPKKHVSSLNELDNENRAIILPSLFAAANDIAEKENFRASGYRCVINNQPDAGQTVFHLHLHVLAKSKLKGGFGT